MASLYASVGPELMHYHLDVEQGTLSKKATVRLPQDIEYAWPHACGKYLYVGSSNTPGPNHHLTALKIGADGALSPHNEITLPLRPVHLSTDIPSTHVLVAFNRPAAFKVYEIKSDGSVGAEVQQPAAPEVGVFPHQVRASLDNRMLILVTRGNHAGKDRPEDPGALKVFKYDNGLLKDEVSIAPNGGYGFGARHCDFHPSAPWLFVSIERQNQMVVFRREGDAIKPEPVCVRGTLQKSNPLDYPFQMAGAVHVHPKGHVVYGVNRAFKPTKVDGREVLAGDENTLVAYKIDEATGDIKAIQHEDTRGVYVRTFHIDPSGRILVAAHAMPMDVQDGKTVKSVPASLSLFRIAADGTLQYLRKYDIDVKGELRMPWVGIF